MRTTAFIWAVIFGIILSVAPAKADMTGAWTPNASVDAFATLRGIRATVSGNPGGGAYTAQTLATATNFWTNPYTGTVPGSPSVAVTIGAAGTFTIVMTFSDPVNNPVLHVDRLGGAVGLVANSSIWTLTSSVSQGGSVSMTRLSGNAAFTVSATSFSRAASLLDGGTECAILLATSACGSIQFNGTGITSLTFSVAMGANPGGGDAVELTWSFVGSNIIVRKQTVTSTGSFSFTGTNGVPATAFVLNTATTNPAQSATFAIPNHAAAVTITEAAQAGFLITATSCVDGSGAPVTSSLAGQILTIAPAAYDGNQTITCTFVNGVVADLAVAKTNTPGSGANDLPGDFVTAGSVTTYQITVTNNGPGTVTGPVVRDTPSAELACSGAVLCVGTPAAACAGPYTVSALTGGSGITLGTMASGQSARLNFSCTVQ